MGVAAVEGYGDITASNAKQIYTAYRKGEIDLSVSQQKYCEKFLSEQEIDEIKYETGGSQKDGYDKIDDAENADSHGGQGGNAAATSIGGALFAAGACVLTKLAADLAKEDGWIGFAYGIATLACSIGALICAKLFDNGYDDRCKAKDNAEDTNSTIDGYTSALADTMDMMNEDMDLYSEQSEEYTNVVNDDTSQMATLQIELAAAEAAGDVEGAANIKAQMQQLGQTDHSDMEEGLDATAARLEEYQMANDESLGVRDAGQSVSDFLKEGLPLGIVATINAVILAVATAFTGLAVGMSTLGSAKSAMHFDWAGAGAGIAGAVMFGVAAGIMGTATSTMTSKAKNEYECSDRGKDMQTHVDALTEMIDEQAAYIETTGASFDATDEESAESQADAQEAAGKASAANGGDPVGVGAGNGGDDKDGDDDGGDKE